MEKQKQKSIFKTWWVLLSFILFLSGLGIFIAGKKVKYKKWEIFGLSYILVEWMLMVTGLVPVYMIVHLISIIHTFMIRKEYFLRLDVLEELDIALIEKEQIKIKEQINKIKYEYVEALDIKSTDNRFKSGAFCHEDEVK